MEGKEPTEEELELIKRAREFVKSLSKEMDGKQTNEILPDDVTMIVAMCLAELYEHNPSSIMMRGELMHTATLIANSVLKFQEQKREKTQALDELWKRN